jgi:hypothetical protein
MANRKLKFHWMLLALVIPPLPLFSSLPTFPFLDFSPLQYHAASLPASPQLKQRRPRNRLGGRGDNSICVIAPGLLERQNIVWSDRPLFLWNASSKISLQQLVVIDQTGKVLWQKPLAATAQSALYAGQPLQPGQFYTWQLQWTEQNAEATAGSINEPTARGTNEYTANYTFQLMEPEQQRQIATELQTLTRPLHSASAETIATQQADYLVNQPEPLWSDALRILYLIENPSRQTTQKLQSWVSAACGQEGN